MSGDGGLSKVRVADWQERGWRGTSTGSRNWSTSWGASWRKEGWKEGSWKEGRWKEEVKGTPPSAARGHEPSSGSGHEPSSGSGHLSQARGYEPSWDDDERRWK